MKLRHFVQKMKKNTLKDSLDAKRDAKSSFVVVMDYDNYDGADGYDLISITLCHPFF